jgi:phosphotransferase system HPr-like phosphotransfer protein
MVIQADGPDAETALDRLCELLHHFKVQEEGE